MIARNAVLTMFKLQKVFSFVITVGNKKVEFIEESIFGHKYQMEWQGEVINLYFDQPLRNDTTNLSCRELKKGEVFVLEQIKGPMSPIIIEKKHKYEGEKRWNLCYM